MPKARSITKNAPEAKRLYNVNPALEPFLLPVSSLKFDPKNSRKHTKRNIDVIMASFREFGQQKALIHKGGIVVAGNGALEAVKALGWTHVAAIEFNGNGSRLAGFKEVDNRSAELSTWNFDQLASNLSALKDSNVELEWVGFSPEEFNAISLGKAWEGIPLEEVKGGNPSEEKPAVIEVHVLNRARLKMVMESLRAWSGKFKGVSVIEP